MLLASYPSRALTVGFGIGLALKTAMLFHGGVFDMEAYRDWGEQALASGLPQTYHGTYFPWQYQIFEAAAWLVRLIGSDYIVVFKASNLLFDTGTFMLLMQLLDRRGASPDFALLYWLHPFFLAVFSLGYIDFQFAFFVVLCLWCLDRDTPRRHLVAGVPLGLAFMMKPQAQVLVVVSFIYAVLRVVRRRDWRPLSLLVAPVVLFTVYETWFVISLWPSLGDRAFSVLPQSYLGVVNVMPALNAQLPNTWYPIAYWLKEPGDPIYAVTDQIRVLTVQVKLLAAALVLATIGLHVSRIERRIDSRPGEAFTEMFAFASLVVPFFMTSAHENHLFLGAVLLVLLNANRLPLSFTISTQLLLVVHALNLFGLYGEHPRWLAQRLRSAFSQELVVAYSLVSVVCFLIMLRPFFSSRKVGG